MTFDDALVARATEIAGPFVQHWEEFRSAPYLCPTGHSTIGYGCTEYADGTLVTLRDPPISLQTATELLSLMLSREVFKLEPFMVRVPTAHQLAALLSFAYNVGVYGADHSTLLKLYNEGFVNAACAHFMDWDKGRDKSGNLVVIPGLENRRRAESLLFETADA
jgi:lysozyme